MTSDSDIDFVDYDKLASERNDRRWYVSTIQVISALNLNALLELSVMHKYSLQ